MLSFKETFNLKNLDFLSWKEVDKMKEAARENICVAKYLKKNGDERQITFTTSLDIIPSNHHPKFTDYHYSNEYVYRVFDLDKQAWRTINADMVLSWHIKK